MESSNVFGGSGEECHSCESGWTMYIGSDHDDEEQTDDIEDYLEDTDDNGSDNNDETEDDDADDSDDSMASDAASGPSYPYKNGESAGHFKLVEKVEDGGSSKKAKGQMEMQEAQLGKNHEEKKELASKRAFGQSDSEVKTNKFWIGKTK